MTTVLWFRRDLRLGDHPALLAAAAEDEVVPLFVVDPAIWADEPTPRQVWLARTLQALDASLDGGLVLRFGDPREVVPRVVSESDARAVHVTAECTPYGRQRDAAVAKSLRDNGIDFVETGSPYAVGPGLVRNGSGDPYQVFTPFARAWREHGWPAPAERATPRVARLDGDDEASSRVTSAAEADVALPGAGEASALARWREFVADDLASYATDRDRPDLDTTSRLSPYLRFGVLHPRTLLADLAEVTGSGAETFRTELAWREFYADVLWHNPNALWSDLRPGLASMVYDDAPEAVAAWKAGETGIPIVDAGMRQLFAEGWMHNRVRMITASFLTKDLHVWWPVGARHFLDHLIDGDPASNNHGWQWTAGTGTDAAPYFRVFNPVTQGRKFDPEGEYVRRWVPQLRGLAGAAAHEPWKHGGADGYPAPIVDHAEERREALRRYDATR
ncbi:deoxyribodipyrimidine photo-lyase [Calidifontibacter sp. DB0510]|uniref:Deoxyribodipyrimidine photo-lyase n=1 Tax=Metallococcus carri TaxID=1656884 RepID=A0A967E8W1_9MICO|nr:deoxyribodipyrimidine photo-lyase [Metallococcus carri]NHN54229.1 deoxyribodipyrimidine photo-lyase [Metallococcus carri]NOP36931.1 deoxyribodipyrimidine photo-lyase [Calidifontibacter sp. DB2511S]